MRKIVILFYLGIVGASYFQLLLFFGVPSPFGIILTPSDHPYIPPMSLVFLAPTDKCEGWSLYYQQGRLGPFTVSVPTIHYFSDGYMVYNSYIITGDPIRDTINYFKALLWPNIVIVPLKEMPACQERVIAQVPGYIVVAVMIIALTSKLYYKFRRVW